MTTAGRGRMAAVLFTDLVGSTELLSRVGEAAFDGLRRVHFAALREAIARSGGAEVKTTGDGLLATFASAADAVGCAVGMQQAVEVHARTAGVPLAIRVGVSVGDVVFEEGDVFGAPVVEAARLVAVARGGQILAAALVRGIAGGRSAARFADVGCLDLKGLPAPVAACEVGWDPLPTPTVPLPPFLTDIGRIFVGREADVDRLKQLWNDVVAGGRGAVFVAGEPGIGKTRLAAELAAKVHADGAAVLAGRCDEDLGVPYQPFVEALRHFVDHTPREHLGQRLGRYGGELARLVPELTEQAPDLPPPLTSDPETERYRLFDAVASWLGAASGDSPLLLVLDDLQWAAKPTLLLLRHVVQSPEGQARLILSTYRDTELPHDHPLVEVVADLRRGSGIERVSLVGLDPDGVVAFMEQAAGQELEEDARALARAIHLETEGNPFFVREVFRHLGETGAVERREGRWTTRRSVEELGIPESVRDVIGRRLSRLSEEANRVLRIAAVVGAEFDLPVLQTAGNLGDEGILSALEEANHARLVTEASPTRYRFSHALVRATLYEQLTAARRVSLHRRVAEAIETCHAGRLDDHLPALAHHWARASAPAADTTRAVDYAAKAGDKALAQLANDEAVTYYTQALELLEAAGEPTHDPRRLKVLISLGEAQGRAGDASYRQTLFDAAHLAQLLDDRAALVRAALANSRSRSWSNAGSVDPERVAVLEAALRVVATEDIVSRAELLATLGVELTWSGDPERRVRLSDEALRLARDHEDPLAVARVLVMRVPTLWGIGSLDERLRNTAELVEVAQRLDDPVTKFQAHYLRYRFAIEAGEIEEAAGHLEAATALSEELGQPTLQWIVGWCRAGRELLAGNHARADQLVHGTFELGQRTGQPDAELYYGSQLFHVRFEQGRLAQVEDVMSDQHARYPHMTSVTAMLTLLYCEVGRDRDAQRMLEGLVAPSCPDFPLDPTWLMTVMTCAAVAAHLGDSERAAALHALLAPHADKRSIAAGICLGPGAHYLGMLATTLQRYEEAEQHFVCAARAHERIGAPAWLARARLEWARMLVTRRHAGDAERGRDLLGQALTTARELGLANVERRAVALLEKVS